MGSLMIAGGLGGVAYWGPVYPADVIKSRMQVDDLKNPQFRGMMDCFRKVVSCGWRSCCLLLCYPCLIPLSLCPCQSAEAHIESVSAEGNLTCTLLHHLVLCRHWPMMEWEGCTKALDQQ